MSPTLLTATFQGGFVGTECELQIPGENGGWIEVKKIYPEDVNREQRFELELQEITALKMVFLQSSDFFGRIIVYKLDLC